MLNNLRSISLVLFLIGLLSVAGCRKKTSDGQEPSPQPCVETKQEAEHSQAADNAPCACTVDKTDDASAATTAKEEDVPQFGLNSPFGSSDETASEPVKEKQLWAKSCLFQKPPEFVVEQWIGQEPDRTGKVVLIEFWGTWCPQCVRAVDTLNRFHEQYGEELVVIGVSDETEETIRNFEKPIHYYSAIDTQKRMKDALGVEGVPHIIIVEPGGHVVWEGFPYQKNYELTDAIVEKILTVARDNEAGLSLKTTDLKL